jgi:hypothetical protein
MDVVFFADDGKVVVPFVDICEDVVAFEEFDGILVCICEG